jgi:hypothetical protein
MVSKEEIEEQNLTTDDVLDRHLAEPQEAVEWLPEWDDHPEERPGDNARIEDETLIWENGEFEARLQSYETTHWKATVTIPKWVGEYYPRGFELKCLSIPEFGFVDDVETEDYCAVEATLILQANHQPVYEVNKYIDELRDGAEQSQQFREELEEKMAAARKPDSEE